MRTRFAPSPNGPLHLGHAYAAMVAHDTARAGDGKFILRIEDIDGERSRVEFAKEFLADLAWLGLHWDGPVVYQSHRLDGYAAAGEQLKDMGLLYPCTCTRAEITAAATAYGPDGPIYPGTCRDRPSGANVNMMKTAWRLDVARAMALTGPLEWFDKTAGLQIATPQIFGDIVVLRKDLPASYHLAATLDDARDGVTLVTRGMDLFPATHVHRLLQALLDLPVPGWLHHPLLIEADGRKLAKRRGAPSLADRRRAGDDGRAITCAFRTGALPAGLSLSRGVHHAA